MPKMPRRTSKEVKNKVIKEKEGKKMKGCGDHSCVIEKPTGQATNGGCRCTPLVLRRRIWELENKVRELEVELSEYDSQDDNI